MNDSTRSKFIAKVKKEHEEVMSKKKEERDKEKKTKQVVKFRCGNCRNVLSEWKTKCPKCGVKFK